MWFSWTQLNLYRVKLVPCLTEVVGGAFPVSLRNWDWICGLCLVGISSKQTGLRFNKALCTWNRHKNFWSIFDNNCNSSWKPDIPWMNAYDSWWNKLFWVFVQYLCYSIHVQMKTKDTSLYVRVKHIFLPHRQGEIHLRRWCFFFLLNLI